MALTDDATVVYLCSTGYAPEREHGVNPLDPQLGFAWPEGIEPVLSEKDAEAPTLAEAEAVRAAAVIRGLLAPTTRGCADHRHSSGLPRGLSRPARRGTANRDGQPFTVGSPALVRTASAGCCQWPARSASAAAQTPSPLAPQVAGTGERGPEVGPRAGSPGFTAFARTRITLGDLLRVRHRRTPR